jgi:RNA polymerase sigma-70 factor, ECF subfamily
MTRSTRDDDDLLVACAQGDEQALGSLYDRFGKVAYGLALRVLRDPCRAEDAVQEAFLAVCGGRRRGSTTLAEWRQLGFS